LKKIQISPFYRIVVLLILIILSTKTSQSQEIPEIKITRTFNQTPLSEFFSYLEEAFGINFFYKEEWIKTSVVSGAFKNSPVTQVLNQVLTDKDLNFRFFDLDMVFVYPKSPDGNVVLSRNESQLIVIGDPLNQVQNKRAKLQGKVLDGKTGDPLPGAVVYNPETKTGVVSDAKGKYMIELPTGELNLRISFMNFENKNLRIQLIQDGNADLEIFEKTQQIEEVTIMGDNKRASKAQMSMIKMSAVSIKELPVLMGEADLIKGMVMMPGVQSVGEMSSGFNVRGGNTDQNLVLVNGAPLFNTTHLFGFFSMVNQDAVSDVTLFKGGMPASFGERTSSVMEIQLKDGSNKYLSINGGIGLINSRLSIEGPFAKKKKSSFMVGGRSTYSDWLLQKTKNPTFMNSVAHFYDLNGTATIEISPKDHLKLTGYLSSDVFNLNTSTLYQYANYLGSLNWKLNLTDKIISQLSLAYSKYDLKVDQKDPYLPLDDYTLKSGIQYGSLKYNLLYYPNEKHHISAGLQAISYRINPGEIAPTLSNSNVFKSSMQKEQSAEVALFADDNFDLSEKVSVSIGFRYTGFFNFGPGVVYNYADGVSKSTHSIIDSTLFNSGQIIKSYQAPEPRLALKLLLPNGGSLRLNYQQTHQFISQISNTAVISPADYWKSAGTYLAPLINDQIAFGFFKTPTKGNFEFSAEAYYKKLQNLPEYKNGALLLMNTHLETDYIPASGYSYGLELMAKKSSGKLNGWISYTFSRTFQKANGPFPEEKINRGAFYPSIYDKPHDLSVVTNYNISRRWRFSGNFVYSSGRPITLPEQKYLLGGNQIVYFSDRNSYRMPSYHRMDVAITLDENLKRKRSWKGSWTFSVYNLYGRKNPYSVFYRKDASLQTMDKDKTQYAIYKLSIIGVPVPSITYNFKF
jgi:hypothetical protein